MKWIAVVRFYDDPEQPLDVGWRGTKDGVLMPGSLWELDVAVGFTWTVLR